VDRRGCATGKQDSQKSKLKLNFSHKQQHRPEVKDKIIEDTNELPPSCINSTKHSVQLDTTLLEQLIGEVRQPPKTFDELQSNYTATQKLILYEHVLKCTPSQRVSFEDNANFAELVAVTKRAQRNQRRHRKSKPTLHEEMQQLVALQMQALQQQQLQLQQQHHHSRRDHQQRDECRQRSSFRQKWDGSRARSRSRENRERKERQRSRSRDRYKTKNYHKKRSRSRSPSRSHSHSRSSHRHKRSHYN